MRSFLLSLLLCSAVFSVAAQNDSVAKPFTFYGYIDAYYGYDFGRPLSGLRPSFYYSYTHHNEVNVNLFFLKFAYAKPRFRANLAPMLGTYCQSNLAGEPFYLRWIFEANVGY
jgi:hypothetical protein